MRSFGFTFVLALVAAIFCALAGWQWQRGNFDTIFGAPPAPVGARLYDGFAPDAVKFIQISANGITAKFALGPDGWQALAPWTDRMDPRAAVSIINFTLGMRVEDVAEIEKIDPVKTGLDQESVNIRLDGANQSPLAIYKLGRSAPWKAEIKDIAQPVPTVFINPRDRHRKKHVYACTGDISPLFKDGMKFLRDHRPFYFNPITLEKIRLRSQQGELTLGKATPESAWRIIKPLDLPTDPAAIKSLIEGIFELQAVKVTDRASVTLSEKSEAVKANQIAIAPFGAKSETVLEIFPPAAADSRDVKATVSDRPATLFELPFKPEPGLVSLADLPVSVNDLRDPTLTRLNIQSLRTISIQPATSSEIRITREPPRPWMAEADGVSYEANEENLFSLLKAVTTSRAIGFESDAATNFTPWGLHRPFLVLRFTGNEQQVLELKFGIDGKGGYFVNRQGSPTVMRVDPSLIAAIAVRPHEWRHSRLWSLDRVNLLAIERKQGTEPPMILKYKFIDESWQASCDGKDLSASLDPSRANFMLSVLEGLKVSRWLAMDDAAALKALNEPSLSITILEKTVNDEGDFTGIANRGITFAPATDQNSGFYYGRLNNGGHPFLLSQEIYQKLAGNLLE